MKKMISVSFGVIVMLAMLCGCGSTDSQDKEIIGLWARNVSEDVVMEFKADRTVVCQVEKTGEKLFDGKWEYDGAALMMNVVDADGGTQGVFTGEKVGDRLVVRSGEDMVILTRK